MGDTGGLAMAGGGCCLGLAFNQALRAFAHADITWLYLALHAVEALYEVIVGALFSFKMEN